MIENEDRYILFCQAINELDAGVELINEYDALLHDYGGTIMFQAESQMIKAIGENPGITAAELAAKFCKTSSACSQLIRKLKQKSWVIQKRNESNSREYNLFLTQSGEEIFKNHSSFENACYRRTFQMLDDFSDEDLKTYIKIQKKLNTAFMLDVSESKKI